MTTFIQLLMAVVITSLTFMFTVIGIQVFHILHDFRESLRKLNYILDNTREISETVARPVTAVNQFFSEVKELVDGTQDQMLQETPDKVIAPNQSQERKGFPHFFHRSGSPLRPS
jgi:hypothetical protein